MRYASVLTTSLAPRCAARTPTTQESSCVVVINGSRGRRLTERVLPLAVGVAQDLQEFKLLGKVMTGVEPSDEETMCAILRAHDHACGDATLRSTRPPAYPSRSAPHPAACS